MSKYRIKLRQNAPFRFIAFTKNFYKSKYRTKYWQNAPFIVNCVLKTFSADQKYHLK